MSKEQERGNEAEERAAENTDRDLWREAPGDYYSPRIFVNAAGGIGMDVGGHCIVLPIKRWHELARAASPVSAPTEELAKTRNALRNLLIEAEYNRTGALPSSAWLDHSEQWWLTFATDLHSWDTRSVAPVSAEPPTECACFNPISPAPQNGERKINHDWYLACTYIRLEGLELGKKYKVTLHVEAEEI